MVLTRAVTGPGQAADGATDRLPSVMLSCRLPTLLRCLMTAADTVAASVATQCAYTRAANGRRYLNLKAFRAGYKSVVSDWLIFADHPASHADQPVRPRVETQCNAGV